MEINNKIFKEEKVSRGDIVNFEAALRSSPDVLLGDNEVCPLKHSFADGIYVREIFIPAGMLIVGKIHKHKHPNFLLEGVVDVVTESGGRERLVGPMSMISPAGTKRALQTITDVRWVTVHENPTNTRNLDELEKYIIAESFEDYEVFKQMQLMPRWRKMLIKFLR